MFALLIVSSASGLSNTAVWTCAHATRVVTSAFSAAPMAMPCTMPSDPMPCCHGMASMPMASHSAPKSALCEPTCVPSIVNADFALAYIEPSPPIPHPVFVALDASSIRLSPSVSFAQAIDASQFQDRPLI